MLLQNLDETDDDLMQKGISWSSEEFIDWSSSQFRRLVI
jgi:hypothetical protein